MLVLFLIVWFGLGLAVLTAMAYDALQDRPSKRYSFAYAASRKCAALERGVFFGPEHIPLQGLGIIKS